MMKPWRGNCAQAESLHIIWLTLSILKVWNERNTALGFGKNMNGEFAEALLHSILEQSQTESSSW